MRQAVPGVTWVVTTLGRSSLSPALEPYAHCIWRGVYPLDMYRVR